VNNNLKFLLLDLKTREFSEFLTTTEATLTDMTFKSALASEKLTQTFILAEQAKNGLKECFIKTLN
jgi:hypothetical protein